MVITRESILQAIKIELLLTKIIHRHLGGGGYGQNIGFGVSAEHVDRMITNMMYNDEEGFFEPYYGQSHPGGDFEKYGHFTQIVWKDTTHVGCVTYTCQHLQNSGSNQALPYTVCNFSPAGMWSSFSLGAIRQLMCIHS